MLAAFGKEHLIWDHGAIESRMVYPEEDLTGHGVRDKPFKLNFALDFQTLSLQPSAVFCYSSRGLLSATTCACDT